MSEKVHIIFEGPDGLRYDPRIHDFIEADGSLASAERVAAAWGMTVKEVEEDRQALDQLRKGQNAKTGDA